MVWRSAPDLTLVARVRGADWIYTYLRSFYVDETRPFGVNNVVFPSVGMPHVLEPLQGTPAPSSRPTPSTEWKCSRLSVSNLTATVK